MSTIEQNYFPNEIFNCYFENKQNLPLIVSPRSKMDLVDWAEKNQITIAKAVKEFGAVVFSGFDLVKQDFSKTLKAITGKSLQVFKGDSTRDEVAPQVYKSTVVAEGHSIPLHQEDAGGYRKNMAKYIAFFCVTPPTINTGHTLVGNVRLISRKIQALMPKLWLQMKTKNLTYTARYLPEDSWRTKWIRWLNPSHATIEKRFGTKNRNEIEAQCRKEGLTCEWDGDCVIVSRKGVPATIDVDGETLFCNQIHLNRFNPELCGGLIFYIFARILLYLTERSMQYNVKFDDGTEINRGDAGRLVTVLREHQAGRNWRKGDLMVVDNVTTMHGKSPHKGPREILVALS
jgi:hypothetical protein